MSFLQSQVVATVKLRTEDSFIPDDWISADFLKRCYERKGGEEKGYIHSFVEEFARIGKKKVWILFKVYILINCFIQELPWSPRALVPKKFPASHSGHCHNWRQVNFGKIIVCVTLLVLDRFKDRHTEWQIKGETDVQSDRQIDKLREILDKTRHVSLTTVNVWLGQQALNCFTL